MKRLLIILAVLVSCGIASAQEFEETLVVYYRTGSAWFIPQLRDNGVRTERFFNDISLLQNMPGVKVSKFELIGSCSPDGTKEYNDFLGNRRSMLFYERFSKELNCPINTITFRNESEDWGTVARFTADDHAIALRKEAVREIEKGEPGIIRRLKSLDGGKTYQKICERIFPEVRTLTVKVTFDMSACIHPVELDEVLIVTDPAPLYNNPYEQIVPHMEINTFPVALTLKTNAAGWLMGISNLAIECDVAKNLAINLPVYYSGWNTRYLTFDFKGLIIQPELRFYVPKTHGFYVAAHAGIAWFNCNGGGDFRYQNTGWKRPTYGGGLNIGYRLPLKKNSGWKVEIGLGAGVYDVNYDVFYNEENGPYVASNQYSLYYGFDQAHVSFMYSFDLGRKEGRR